MMKNQSDPSSSSSAASEEAIATEYVVERMSAVDLLPGDAIRGITGMRQCSSDVEVMLGQLDDMLDSDAPTDEFIQVLMAMQERQDEKLRLLQEHVSDPVEQTRRNLDRVSRAYRISSGLGPVVVTEKPVGKRVRRSLRGEAAGGPGGLADVQNDASDQSGPSKPNRRSVGAGGQRGLSAGLRRKAGYRRTPRGGNAGGAGGSVDTPGSSGSAPRECGVTTRGSKAGSPEDSPDPGTSGGNGAPIDPDEPTYCLCEQCVSLVNKPKGKWYCPRCRGDKPTNMKPRSVFLKELELYNQEKEERADKNTKRREQQQQN